MRNFENQKNKEKTYIKQTKITNWKIKKTHEQLQC